MVGLAAAGLTIGAIGAVSSIIGSSQRDSARRRAGRNIVNAQVAFLDTQRAVGDQLAAQLRGLGLEADDAMINFLTTRLDPGRTEAGAVARVAGIEGAQSSLDELRAAVPGLNDPTRGTGNSVFDRAVRAQDAQTQESLGRDLNIFGSQAEQQGRQAFDRSNEFNRAFEFGGLQERATDIQNLAGLGDAERSLENQRQMIALNAALGRADQAGGGFSTFGALGQAVGGGLLGASAFSGIPKG